MQFRFMHALFAVLPMIAVGCSAATSDDPTGATSSVIGIGGLHPPIKGFQTAWSDVMGPTGAPTLASWGVGRVDLFARAGNALYQKTRTDSGWLPAATDTWQLTTGLASDPSAVGWQGQNIDIVWRGTANQVIHFYWDGTGSWKTEDLGGIIDGRPSVAVSADGSRMDVFARVGTQLWHRAWALGVNTWSGWENVGPSIDSDPVAVASGTGRIDLFYRAANGETRRYLWDGRAIGHQYYQALSGESFVEQPSLGGYAKDIPAVAALDGTSTMVVFVQGGDDGIYRRDITGGNVQGTWTRMDGCMSGAAAATYVGGRIDLVVRSNSDGHAYHNFTSILPSTTEGAAPLCACTDGSVRAWASGKCEHCGDRNELACPIFGHECNEDMYVNRTVAISQEGRCVHCGNRGDLTPCFDRPGGYKDFCNPPFVFNRYLGCIDYSPPPPQPKPPSEDGCGSVSVPAVKCCQHHTPCNAGGVCDSYGNCAPAHSTGVVVCGGKAPVGVSICVTTDNTQEVYSGAWCSDQDAETFYKNYCTSLKTEHGYTKCDVAAPGAACVPFAFEQ
jgi:hypothetical protein